MTRQDEIKKLKADIKRLQFAVAQMQILLSVADEITESLRSLEHPAMSTGTMETASDSADALNRTLYQLQDTLDYSVKRIEVIRKLDRDDKYGFSTYSRKPQAKGKKKVQKFTVRYEGAKTDNQFRVFVGDKYVGIVRKSKTKYHSGNVIDFTKEAKEKREFVTADGKLNVEEIAKFSNTRFKSWKYGTNGETFKTYQEAAKALIKEKMPEAKIQY